MTLTEPVPLFSPETWNFRRPWNVEICQGVDASDTQGVQKNGHVIDAWVWATHYVGKSKQVQARIYQRELVKTIPNPQLELKHTFFIVYHVDVVMAIPQNICIYIER